MVSFVGLTLVLFIFFINPIQSTPQVTYNVLSFGAKPDGNEDSSKAFVASWYAACTSTQPATIYVPLGRFLLRDILVFRGNCKNNEIEIRIDGTLVAPSDYRVLGNASYWIYFHNVDGVTINGGTLDGQGNGLWACKLSGKNCPGGVSTLGFGQSKNLAINGLTSQNSPFFHIVVNNCLNVKLQGVNITATGDSPNTDGIHIQFSSGVTILGSKISTGDDCISIGPGTTNMWIEDISCGPGHGISIGSLGNNIQEPGVQNVTVKNVTFTGTQNGVRIKTWGRPSNGFVRGVLFQNALMVNVQNPILIDQNYCPHNKDCPGQDSGIIVGDVAYEDIYGTSETKFAVKFDCSSKYPCTEIKLQNVKLIYKNQPAEAFCANAWGSASAIVEPASCLKSMI